MERILKRPNCPQEKTRLYSTITSHRRSVFFLILEEGMEPCLEGWEGEAGLVHAYALVGAPGAVPHHPHVLLVGGVQGTRHHLALHVLVVHVTLHVKYLYDNSCKNWIWGRTGYQTVFNEPGICQLSNSVLQFKDKMPKIWNKYSQKRKIRASVPISTFMWLWANYIFPRGVCLFCWRK